MKIIDVQTTPSGYYQIAFRSDTTGHRIVATQHGRGGCVLFTPRDWEEELFTWLDTQRPLAIDHLTKLGYPELADDIRNKAGEWEDSVILSLVDLVEMKVLSVEG